MKGGKKKFARYSSIAISFLLTLLLVWAISREEGLSGLAEKLKGIDSRYLFTYLALSLCGLFLRALRYLVCFRAIGNEPNTIGFKRMIITTGVRNGFVDLLPARLGELTYFYILKRYQLPLSMITTVFGLCTALDIVVLLFVVFIAGCLSFFETTQSLVSWQIAPLFLALSLLLLFAVAHIDYLLRLLVRVIPRSMERLHSFTQQMLLEIKAARDSGRYIQLFTLTLMLRIAKYSSLYFLLMSIVSQYNFKLYEIDPLLSTLAFIVAEASASLPISGFMGFGAYEGAWQMIFLGTSTKIPSLSSVIFLVHIISQVVGYSIAGLSVLAFAWDQRSLNTS